MSNEYYSHTTYPSNNAPLSSAGMRSELDNIDVAFSKLPVLAGNANKLVAINTTADGMTVKDNPSGALVGTSDTQTLTNKTINLANNTVTGTLAEFNTAISDADVASIAGVETLTNKTIDANTNTILNVGVDQLLNTVAGTDTITAAANAGITSYIAGQVFSFVAAGANTGAVTLNINSLGAKNVYKSGTTPLDAGDIASGAAITVIYDGTQFQLGAGAGGSGAKANGCIYENSRVVTSNYTMNKSGFSVGPVTVATGAAVTVATGERWVQF